MTAYLIFVGIFVCCAVYGFIEDGVYGALFWGFGIGATIANFMVIYCILFSIC